MLTAWSGRAPAVVMTQEEGTVGVTARLEIGSYRCEGSVVEENDAFLLALAGHQCLLGPSVRDVGAVEAGELRAPHSRGVQCVEQCLVAEQCQARPLVCRGGRSNRQSIDIKHNECHCVVDARGAVGDAADQCACTVLHTLVRQIWVQPAPPVQESHQGARTRCVRDGGVAAVAAVYG